MDRYPPLYFLERVENSVFGGGFGTDGILNGVGLLVVAAGLETDGFFNGTGLSSSEVAIFALLTDFVFVLLGVGEF